MLEKLYDSIFLSQNPYCVLWESEEEKEYLRVAQLINNGLLNEAIQSSLFEPLLPPILFERRMDYNSIDEVKEAWGACVDKYLQDSSSTPLALRHHVVLALAMLFLGIVVQKEITGPSFDFQTPSEKLLSEQRGESRTLPVLHHFLMFANPDTPTEEFEEKNFCSRELLASLLSTLSPDGEEMCAGHTSLFYLWAAEYLLCEKISSKSVFYLFLWRARVAFLHQKLVLGSHQSLCPSLVKIFLCDFASNLRALHILPSNFHLGMMENSTATLFSDKANIWDLATGEIGEGVQSYISTIGCTIYEQRERFELFASLCLELSVRLAFCDRSRAFHQVSRLAGAFLGREYGFTGIEGVRRKFQTKSYAQLVAYVRKSDPIMAVRQFFESANETAAETANEDSGDAVKLVGTIQKQDGTDSAVVFERQNLNNNVRLADKISGHRTQFATHGVQLDSVDQDNDILEFPLLTGNLEGDKRGEIEALLSPPEQLLLLSFCQALRFSSPSHDDILLNEQISVLTQRLLLRIKRSSPLNEEGEEGEEEEEREEREESGWLVRNAALLMRSDVECERLKTRERALLQYKVLQEDYENTSVSVGRKIENVWEIFFPTRRELTVRIGEIMMKSGSYLSACELYTNIKDWENAANCLIVANRKREASNLLHQNIKQNKFTSPSLLNALGEIDNDPSKFEEAFAASNGRDGRSQRLLSNFYLRAGDIGRAIEHIKKALAINPCRADMWFRLGSCELSQGNFDGANNAFMKVINFSDDNGDAFANLTSIAMRQKNFEKAYLLSKETVKRHRENWKVHLMRLQICLRVMDVNGAIECIGALTRLGEVRQISPSYLSCLEALVEEDVTLRNGKSARSAATMICDSLFDAANNTGSGVETYNGSRSEFLMSYQIYATIANIQECINNLFTARTIREKEFRVLLSCLEASVGVKKYQNSEQEGEQYEIVSMHFMRLCERSLQAIIRVHKNLGRAITRAKESRQNNPELLETETERVSVVRTLVREIENLVKKFDIILSDESESSKATFAPIKSALQQHLNTLSSSA